MKDTSLTLRSLITVLALLLTTSFAVRADESAGFLSNLHQFRINNSMALAAYYQYSATAEQGVNREIVAALGQAEANMKAITNSTASALSANQLQELKAAFETYKKMMQQNVSDVTEIGYPDLRLVSEMANHALGLGKKSQELYAIARESSRTPVNERVEAARSAAVNLAEMLARYSARSYSSVSQTFQGASYEKSLDEQALAFEALLGKVNQGSGSPAVQGLLEDVQTKWEFIRNSYINYNRNNVVFVIERYSRAIIDQLGRAINDLESA